LTRAYSGATRFGFLGLAAFLITLHGETPATSLRVLSAQLNAATHQATIHLLNTTTNKTAVAYNLEIKAFDSDGRELQDYGVGWDNLSPDPTSDAASKYVLPGRTVIVGLDIEKQSVSVKVFVTGAVYLDRTFEGASSSLIFDARSRQARAVRQALAVLKPYPATLEATRKAVQALIAIGSPAVSGAVAKALQLRTLPDLTHPLAEDSLPKSGQEWDEMVADLDRLASFFETQSQGVKQ
jgi:hypothetical protein